ncbi:glutamate-rich protein 2 isoform X1 [Callorhinchus milii]|uniref:glutamate-rich protein 2 isoform X1 n=1 Tax=Callorhinchus milii TaxID=7868 RepID=UPI001C3FEF03|nr:glutamate-rich protein 2 isoform X1 [Callorhinchus milii]
MKAAKHLLRPVGDSLTGNFRARPHEQIVCYGQEACFTNEITSWIIRKIRSTWCRRPCSAKKIASSVMVSTGKLEVLDPEDNAAVDKGESATRNGMYQQSPSTSSMQSSYHKTHVLDTTKKNFHMQERTDGKDQKAESLTTHNSSSLSTSAESSSSSGNCAECKSEDGDDEGSTPSIQSHNLGNTVEALQSSGDDDENEEDEDNGEENGEAEGKRAPIQLLGEFLKAVMDRDYLMAKKLCEMILIYEPDNSEALQFKPLIEAKLHIDEATHQNDEDDDIESHNSDEGGSEESDGEEDEEYVSSPNSDEEHSGSSSNEST